MQPTTTREAAIAAFQGEPGRLVESLFRHARKGRTWYALNPDTLAETLGQERRRIIRALEVLEERGLVTLRASDARQRYTRLDPNANAAALAAELAAKFTKREQQEIQRLGQVLSLVTQAGCQANALVSYFGEQREADCGHCTFCATGTAAELPPLPPSSAIAAEFPAPDFHRPANPASERAGRRTTGGTVSVRPEFPCPFPRPPDQASAVRGIGTPAIRGSPALVRTARRLGKEAGTRGNFRHDLRVITSVCQTKNRHCGTLIRSAEAAGRRPEQCFKNKIGTDLF